MWWVSNWFPRSGGWCCAPMRRRKARRRSAHSRALPLGRGHIRTRRHDYTRPGTDTLFAAQSYLEGKLIYRPEQKHTHVEWLRVFKRIGRETPQTGASI